MMVKFGASRMDYPGPELQELESSADIAGSPAALTERLERDGYLYLPGLLEREKVLAARERVLRFMAERSVLDGRAPVLEGVVPPRNPPEIKIPISYGFSEYFVCLSPMAQQELIERTEHDGV